jgi:ferredoxin-type protein NapH
LDKIGFRGGVQLCAALIQNANFKGFVTGKIYQGAGKNVCVPGLNCYSCPGALGSCPVGALQNALDSRPVRFPYYVAGLLLFFGALLGRAVCGFLCPFGFVQELIHMIPLPRKKIRSFRGDKPLRRLKYAVLIIFVLALPLAVPYLPAFCKFVCPAGTLEGGIPIALLNGAKYDLGLGFLFGWKIFVLAVCAAACLFVYRPFCKYLCPLGALYGLLNGVALYRMRPDKSKCTGCGACAAICPMGVDPSKTPNSAECIRCGKCVRGCPEHSLLLSFPSRGVSGAPGLEI